MPSLDQINEKNKKQLSEEDKKNYLLALALSYKVAKITKEKGLDNDESTTLMEQAVKVLLINLQNLSKDLENDLTRSKITARGKALELSDTHRIADHYLEVLLDVMGKRIGNVKRGIAMVSLSNMDEDGKKSLYPDYKTLSAEFDKALGQDRVDGAEDNYQKDFDSFFDFLKIWSTEFDKTRGQDQVDSVEDNYQKDFDSSEFFSSEKSNLSPTANNKSVSDQNLESELIQPTLVLKL